MARIKRSMRIDVDFTLGREPKGGSARAGEAAERIKQHIRDEIRELPWIDLEDVWVERVDEERLGE